MNSRQKGKRGEREFAQFLRDNFGLDAKRGVQYAGSPDSPDVVGSWEGTHPEVKRVEKLDIATALAQAVRDAGWRLPYVGHRVNGGEWAVTVRARDLRGFLETIKKESKT